MPSQCVQLRAVQWGIYTALLFDLPCCLLDYSISLTFSCKICVLLSGSKRSGEKSRFDAKVRALDLQLHDLTGDNIDVLI